MRQEDFDATIESRYFEDYEVGSIYEYGDVTITEQDIIAFATRYDPQYFHVDREAAALGPFRGLIASGWHTASILMRLYADHYLSKTASLASPGVREMVWRTPVRPGDTLRLRVEVIDKKESRSNNDRGVVTTCAELVNQIGETVIILDFPNFLQRRPRP